MGRGGARHSEKWGREGGEVRGRGGDGGGQASPAPPTSNNFRYVLTINTRAFFISEPFLTRAEFCFTGIASLVYPSSIRFSSAFFFPRLQTYTKQKKQTKLLHKYIFHKQAFEASKSPPPSCLLALAMLWGSRCIECHAVPSGSRNRSRARWTCLVEGFVLLVSPFGPRA